MSDNEWDADDFEPTAPRVGATDKWEGEDDDDVKDSWDAEDEEEKKTSEPEDPSMKAVQRKKKKPLAERIAEKEAARLAQAQEKDGKKELSKEDQQAEAERLKKIQEHADLRLAKEAFGVDSTGIDAMFPVTDEEFTKFREALFQKITSFNSSKCYHAFVEKFVSDLTMELAIDDLKKISTSTSTLYHEKQRQQKEQEKKKKKKSKKIVMERDTDFNDIAGAATGDYDDSYYDDDFI